MIASATALQSANLCHRLSYSALADPKDHRGAGSISRKHRNGAASSPIANRLQTGFKQDADREQSEERDSTNQTYLPLPGTPRTLPETARYSLPRAPLFGHRSERAQTDDDKRGGGPSWTNRDPNMNEPEEQDFQQISRADARAFARDGIAALARAFNHCGRDDVVHRYTDDVQSRFLDLAAEVVQLVEHGDIEVNAAHGMHLQSRDARNDEALQALIRRASQKAPIRGR